MAELYMAWGGDGKQAAHALLERAVAEQWGIPLPELARQERGKPWFPQRPELHFSLSHSREWALCGLGARPLGVDVEQIRPRRPGLARRVCTRREMEWLEERGSRWEDFYTLWTLKEALCKCTGAGLGDPRTLEVPLLEPGLDGVRGRFRFFSYGGSDWRAAACTAEGERCGPIRWLEPGEWETAGREAKR